MILIKKFYHLVTALAVFIIYLFTIAPSVVQIDSGELAAVQATLGIAHPTGYPLFTIAGYLFSLIPLPLTKIFQLNLLAAISCSAGVGIFVYMIKFCFDNFSVFNPYVKKEITSSKKKQKGKQQKGETTVQQETISETTKIISAVIGGLVLAFSKTFWFQSTSVEVYSLHLLLITLIILFLLKAYILSFNNEVGIKPWLVFAIFLAIGFTNHMTTLLILPGTVYLYFTRYKFNKQSFKRLGIMILIFIPVLILIYAYLPLRALQQPIINWGNPLDLERILRHISGKQYQVWLFSSFEAAGKQFDHFVSILPEEFSFTLLFSLVGLFFSYKKAKKMFIFILITFVFSVLYSINYDIADIDAYFLLAFIMLSLFGAFGALYLLLQKKIAVRFSILLPGLILLIQFYSNFNKVNQSNIYTFEDYTKAVLNTVPRNSIIFSYQWDYFISASYYYQQVENFRKDVTVVDKELLRRSWYYNQLNSNDPDLLKGVRHEVDQFLVALQPFERSENFDANRLETLYRSIMTNLISTNADKRDYFIAPEIINTEMNQGEFSLPPGYTIVPYLFSYKVVKGEEYVPAPDPDFKIRLPERKNIYIENIMNIVGRVLQNRALYEIQYGRREKAKIYVNKIINDLPGVQLDPALQQLVN